MYCIAAVVTCQSNCPSALHMVNDYISVEMVDMQNMLGYAYSSEGVFTSVHFLVTKFQT
jgi:hypothetical protein